MNVITVNINGMEYNLRGEENEEYLHKVARQVDKKLKHLLSSNPKLSLSSAAVLTALNSVDDMLKCDQAYSEVEEEIQKLNAAVKSKTEESEALRKQLKYLEDYNSELQSKLKNMDNQDFLKEKQRVIEKLNKELNITEENAKNYLNERNTLKLENKELKFQLQSYKYKTMDLQNKLIEKGIELTKVKKTRFPIASSD
ncbi:cell division protein ZapA [Candidatus Clostridium radicumherbarum]|uniref:Cell division protein ZapA n=1 Tax=Candidatus Clostridium radicumherbarum TaxID=3381662 RepID=A0ABW8TWH3_9CLOT